MAEQPRRGVALSITSSRPKLIWMVEWPLATLNGELPCILEVQLKGVHVLGRHESFYNREEFFACMRKQYAGDRDDIQTTYRWYPKHPDFISEQK